MPVLLIFVFKYYVIIIMHIFFKSVIFCYALITLQSIPFITVQFLYTYNGDDEYRSAVRIYIRTGGVAWGAAVRLARVISLGRY